MWERSASWETNTREARVIVMKWDPARDGFSLDYSLISIDGAQKAPVSWILAGWFACCRDAIACRRVSGSSP